MQDENKSVTTACTVVLTPAQEALLQLLATHGPRQFKKSLNHVKEFVLYLGSGGAEISQEDLDHCYLVNLLEKALSKVAKEHR